MISRNRSISTAAAMSIECTTSANSTVTCLYSADWVACVSRRAALTAELGCRGQLCAARPTRQSRHRSAPRLAVVHASIVSPLVRHVCHIAPGMQPARLHQTDEPSSTVFTICTPIDHWPKPAIPCNCRRFELRTRDKDFRASGGRPDELSNLLTDEPADGSGHRGGLPQRKGHSESRTDLTQGHYA